MHQMWRAIKVIKWDLRITSHDSSLLREITRITVQNQVFQFTFYCDICHDGYKTRFIESKTYKQTGLFGMFGRAISTGSALVGQHRIGNAIERSVDILNDRKQGMFPEWRKEWEEAFELAQNETKQHFCRCSRCKKYVCESDWNEQDNLCVECAPRENVELTAIRAERMVRNERKGRNCERIQR